MTARMGLPRSENVTKGLRDVKEGGISARKAGLLWGLSMKKSTLHRRIEVPSPTFFLIKNEEKSRLQIG